MGMVKLQITEIEKVKRLECLIKKGLSNSEILNDMGISYGELTRLKKKLNHLSGFYEG